MTDATVIENEPHDVADVGDSPHLPADPAPAPAGDQSLDDLLAEFVQKTAPPPADPEPAADDTAATNSELDQLLREMSGPSAEQQRIDQLSGELSAARAAEIERQSKQDFAGFSEKLQSQLGPNVPDDYAKTQLLAMAAEKPELYAAWYHRHLTRDQIAAADREFKELEVMYWKVQQAADDGRKQDALRQIEQRAQQVDWARNAHKVLNRAWNEVRTRASKVLPPIDADATQVRDDVAWAVRSASAKAPEEPPPRLGNLTDAEFRNYTKQWGF